MSRTLTMHSRARSARLAMALALTGALVAVALPQTADAVTKGDVWGGPICCLYQPKADLVVADYVVKDHVTVRNQGDYEAPASRLTVTEVAGTYAVPRLAAGVSFTITLPSSRCYEGTYVAKADSTNVVYEASEGNNTRTVRVFC